MCAAVLESVAFICQKKNTRALKRRSLCGRLLSDTGVNIPRSSVSQSPLRCVFSGQPQCLCQGSDTHTATIVKQQDKSRHNFNTLKKEKKESNIMLATAVAILSVVSCKVKALEMVR